MKKYRKIIGSVFVLLWVAIGLSACSDSKPNIPDETSIAQDMRKYLEKEGFSDYSVQIDLEKQNKDTVIFEVTVSMTAPVKYQVEEDDADKVFCGTDIADVIRKYRLEYLHYDKGGWQLEKCEERDEDERKAIPRVFDIPKEYIAEELFDGPGDQPRDATYGHKLCVDNAKYGEWTIARSRLYSPEDGNDSMIDYITNIEITEKNEAEMRLLVRCEAESEVLKITEYVDMTWKLNESSFIWECISKKSCVGQHEIKDGLVGHYVRDDSTADSIILEKIGDDLYSTGYGVGFYDQGEKSIVHIKGVYYLDIQYDRDWESFVSAQLKRIREDLYIELDYNYYRVSYIKEYGKVNSVKKEIQNERKIKRNFYWNDNWCIYDGYDCQCCYVI